MPKPRTPTSFELFTGAGGLALGVAQAGYEHLGLVEWNEDACDTLRANRARLPIMADWDVFQADARKFDFTPYTDRADLLAAGAPCQPFSLGGKHRGHEDDRNLFPVVFRAVAEMRPKAVIVENVKGLLRTTFRDYFEYIVAQLAFPEITPKRPEDWLLHWSKLRRLAAKPPQDALRYRVRFKLVNAADYGLPQRRERVFVVAFREDVDTDWPGLAPTHSEDALLHDQWVSGEYWTEHKVSAPAMPERLRSRVDRLWSTGRPLFTERWHTVRDALRGLPEPKDGVEHPRILNHVGNPGARSYTGHTGSPYDEPSKTLKAGDHGVPGGENTLRHDDGTVRYFTVREAARLQGFPDEYKFVGAWCEVFRQLGNAVPVDLARAVATSVKKELASARKLARIA